MSLATRCPACHTVFRVVQDQLRVSGGWVRCGQCQEVFNALETLFDLETDAAEADAAAAAARTAAGTPIDNLSGSGAAGTREPAASFPGEGGDREGLISEGPLPEDHWAPAPPHFSPPRDAPDDAPSIDTPWGASDPGGVVVAALPPDARPSNPEELVETMAPPAGDAAAAVAQDSFPQEAGIPAGRPESHALRDLRDFDDLRSPGNHESPESEPASETEAPPAEDHEADGSPTPSRFIGPAPAWARSPSSQRRRGADRSRPPKAASESRTHLHSSSGAHRRRRKPEFVRQAERAAMWRRPVVRAALGGTACMLALLLLGQVGYQYRDVLSAQVPALSPLLRASCAHLGCRIVAPRALERLRLDSSDLTRTDQDQVLRFTADLHNGANFAVLAPALDVSFTDALGRIVSRKVLQPADLGLRAESIEADGRWHIDARLAVGELGITGYTVEVFYP